MRVCVLGNSGSGKSTFAARCKVPVLELDSIYWEPHQIAVARAPEAVRADLEAFIAANDAWVIEGCYADLIEAALPACTQLVFLDPGVEVCLANARARPFEPHKYDRAEDQEKMLGFLLDWIRAYPTREGPTGWLEHERVFQAFDGAKRKVTDLSKL